VEIVDPVVIERLQAEPETANPSPCTQQKQALRSGHGSNLQGFLQEEDAQRR